jgi:Winged helix DNA-binding domain
MFPAGHGARPGARRQPASPYVALWNRLSGFDPAALDRAFARRQVVKATLMRVTMHAVHAEDHQAFREAMEPTLRASRLGDPRFAASGLTPADADGLIGGLLDFAGQPRTAGECAAWLSRRVDRPMPPAAWRMLRQYAPLWHVPAGRPWSFGTQASFVAAHPRPVLADAGVSGVALQSLIRPGYQALVTRTNGDVLPTLLVDGYVAGVWRAVREGIEATAFHPLPDSTWAALAGEARALVPFLADRDPEVYRRYHHWWGRLPSAEVRILLD